MQSIEAAHELCLVMACGALRSGVDCRGVWGAAGQARD
jgi:hypothetical protein